MSIAVKLRLLAVEDAAVMAEVLADPSLYAFTGGRTADHGRAEPTLRRTGGGRSPDGSQQWINLVVTWGGQPIGYAQATVPASGPTEIAWVIVSVWSRPTRWSTAKCAGGDSPLRRSPSLHVPVVVGGCGRQKRAESVS